MRSRRNRRRKVTQKITEDKQSASSQLVLQVSKSLHQRLKSKPEWTNLVIEAITEKLAKLENNSQFLNTEAVFQMILEARKT